MNLRIIEIKKLFGMFDHTIKLKADDRITIIHGPNGVGKTTVLTLIHDIFQRKFHTLQKIPFSCIRLVFDDSTTLELECTQKGRGTLVKATVSGPSFEGKSSNPLPVELYDDRVLARKLGIPTHMIEDLIPELDQVGPREWFDRSTGDMLSLTEVLLRYGESLPVEIPTLAKVPNEVSHILDSLSVYFIQTQRLLSEEVIGRGYGIRAPKPVRKPRSVVQKWAIEMAGIIQEKLRESGALAASLDRQFPSTLLSDQLPDDANENRIREIYNDQTAFRNRLMKAGLLEEEDLLDLPGEKLAESDLKVLWFYFRDVKEKLKVFEELLPKIELFRNIINSRFLRKSCSVDREKGFLIQNEEGTQIPLSALSSGEQHELVLAYELLFKVKENSLILVDEPELSLHVTWQHKFLEDISRISDLVDIDFLIATHSPSIIHNRSDLMTELS